MDMSLLEDEESIDRQGRDIWIYIAATERNDVYLSGKYRKATSSRLLDNPSLSRKETVSWLLLLKQFDICRDSNLLYCCSSSKFHAVGCGQIGSQGKDNFPVERTIITICGTLDGTLEYQPSPRVYIVVTSLRLVQMVLVKAVITSDFITTYVARAIRIIRWLDGSL